MHPIVVFRGKHPDAEVEDCPTASPDADLNHLIDIMVETEERFIRIIEENKCVGVVTRGSLLRAIQGKETS
jgi:glycine betaine/proline transport system ATP-binding protein